MKILIFSDTHLTHKFDESTYKLLVKIINSVDQVVINGDFWDSDFTDFDRFVKSKWHTLFPLLLKKHTVYIHGNHDPSEKTDERTSLFSVIAKDTHLLDADSQSFAIQHGHRLLKTRRNWFLNIYYQILYKTENTQSGYLLRKCIHFFEWLGFHLLGSDYMTDTATSRHINDLMKQTKHGSNWLVCGESHCPELDIPQKYANSGCIRYGCATYLVITGGDIKLHKEKY